MHYLSKYVYEKCQKRILSMLNNGIAVREMTEIQKKRRKRMIVSRLLFEEMKSVFAVFFLCLAFLILMLSANIYAFLNFRFHLCSILAVCCAGLVFMMSFLLIFIRQKRTIIKKMLGQFIDQQMTNKC